MRDEHHIHPAVHSYDCVKISARGMTSLLLLLILSLAAFSDAPPENVRHGTFQFTYTISQSDNTKLVHFCTLIPQTIPGRQVVHSLTLATTLTGTDTTRIFNEGNNRYALFEFAPTSSLETITITCDVDLCQCDLATMLANHVPAAAEQPAMLRVALADEKYLEVKDRQIRAAADSITGKDDIERLKNIMKFVANAISLAKSDLDEHGAVWALNNKQGDCKDFSRLFVTFCRAKGLPARVVNGFVTDTDLQNGGELAKAGHEWAEVYLPSLGWVPFDPTFAAGDAASFDNFGNNYLTLSIGSSIDDAVLHQDTFFDCEGTGSKKNETVAITLIPDVTYLFHQ